MKILPNTRPRKICFVILLLFVAPITIQMLDYDSHRYWDIRSISVIFSALTFALSVCAFTPLIDWVLKK